jgi:hypothetical protein
VIGIQREFKETKIEQEVAYDEEFISNRIITK